MKTGTTLAANSNATSRPDRGCRTEFFGNERSPVLILDAFFDQPDALVEYAGTRCTFQPVGNKYYPGVRARAPDSYIETVVGRIEGLAREVFGLDGKRLAGADSDFSLVTTIPAKLQLPQLIPPFDG
jgi:Family of unknown function (DUF6445)